MSRFEDYVKVGELAKEVGISPVTVARIADSGKVRAFRLPTKRGDRRIHRDEFLKLFQVSEPKED